MHFISVAALRQQALIRDFPSYVIRRREIPCLLRFWLYSSAVEMSNGISAERSRARTGAVRRGVYDSPRVTRKASQRHDPLCKLCLPANETCALAGALRSSRRQYRNCEQDSVARCANTNIIIAATQPLHPRKRANNAR